MCAIFYIVFVIHIKILKSELLTLKSNDLKIYQLHPSVV